MASIPSEIKAMGFTEAKSEVKEITYTPKPMGKFDADLKVLYNGICHSDLHMIDNDWGMSRYPLIPGHEVVAEVIAVGPDVTNVKVGDKVGLGCLAKSCKKCEWCTGELDNLCPERCFTYFANIKDETGEWPHHGGFSSYIRTYAPNLFLIPEGYSLEHAGPLMCAGHTVGSPLLEFCGGKFEAKGKKIGIIGIGGLGHLALQFCNKMGAETVAISRGTSKAELAKSNGADSLLDSTDTEEMGKAAGTFHYLMVCMAGGKAEVSQYLPLLRPYGVLHFVGVPEEPVKFMVQEILFQRLTISASPIGSSEQMAAMLEFCAKNDIKPMIEVFKHSEAATAIEKLRKNEIRFRAVIQNDLV